MGRAYRLERETFRPRLAIVSTLTLLILCFMSIRLFVRSVAAHQETLAEAQGQYLVLKQIAPQRGTIYAIDGLDVLLKPLATNRRTYALSVVPRNISDIDEMARAIAPRVDQPVAAVRELIDNDRLYLAPLRHGLSEEEKDQLAALNLSGLLLIEEEQRYYPEMNLGAHILGFVNAEHMGKYGLEQAYNEELRGSGGEIVAERDVRGRLLEAEERLPVRDGSSLVLTIDRNIQGFVEQTLQQAIETYLAESGTIVVMDVQTGGILAMASFPTYDPNEFRKVPKEEVSRFLNPAISAVWEPGSIFKTIIMAAALDHGVVEPDTEGVFSNAVRVGNYEIHTAEDKAFGRETMTQVLENSDNVAMVWVAEKMGSDAMYQTLAKFDFGLPLGIDLPGEIGGYLLPVKNWHDIERSTISFGQGVSTTPLQMVSAMAALANGGTLMQPHLVQKIVGADGSIIREVPPTVKEEQVIRPETSVKITGMMVSVVERGHGKRAKVPGYKIAGKTGTAQVPNPDGGYYEDRHIGGFGGFFPADNPRFAMIVKLDQPKTVRFAESSAAPTFGEIARFILHYYKIPPTEPIE